MGRCSEVASSTASRRSRRCGRRTPKPKPKPKPNPTPTPTPNPNPDPDPNPNPTPTPSPNPSRNPNPNQVWAPYYTLHKLLAGLLQQYVLAGNLRALEIAEGLARYIGEG